MNAAIYWKGMRTTNQALKKSCRYCQTNKRRNIKYGHLPHKTVMSNPWECLCVDLIGPYTLKGKDNSQIDFVALTIIDPTSSWFEIADLPVVTWLFYRQTANGNELLTAHKIFDMILDCISKLVNKTWLCRYPRCCYLIYNDGSEFQLHFEYLCRSYGIKDILEWVHQVLGQMLCTAEIDTAESVTPDDLTVFLDNAAWAIYSTYHTILKASPGAAIFRQDMLFNIPFMPD